MSHAEFPIDERAEFSTAPRTPHRRDRWLSDDELDHAHEQDAYPEYDQVADRAHLRVANGVPDRTFLSACCCGSRTSQFPSAICRRHTKIYFEPRGYYDFQNQVTPLTDILGTTLFTVAWATLALN
jgi:hypothetical protein